MKPLGISPQSELMSAMSAMNMREDDGEHNVYFTDMYDTVKAAHNICSSNMMHPEKNVLLIAIEHLKTNKLNEKHELLKHAIEHIESAIDAIDAIDSKA